MHYGLIGEHLTHSFSKEIHESLADYSYELYELNPEELETFFAEKSFRAINVTIPYKEKVLPFLDYISDSAKTIGAVNTIVNESGKLKGYNTDYLGLEALIHHIGIDINEKKVLILGTGGTSKTAEFVARKLGASEVIFVSRNPNNKFVSYHDATQTHMDADVIINTTPCGMFPKVEEQPIDLSHFNSLCGVVDVIYNPLSTRFVLDAKERKVPSEGGLYMLVAQAVFASSFFLGTEYPRGIIDSIYHKIRSKKRNIVLVGMPGSGKSTIGKQISQRLDYPFVDIDEEVVKEAKMKITEIFNQFGEKYFRHLESLIIQKEALKTGQVISTGGGSILRRENIQRLKQNGVLYFLNRPWQELLPSDERPLADNQDKIKKLYEERLPVYESVSDEVIFGSDEEDTVMEIERRHIR